MSAPRTLASLAAALLGTLCGLAAHAGSFSVSPTRIDLGKDAKSAIIEIANDDEQKLSFQANLLEWHQGSGGKDEYDESRDLVFFPRLFTVEPHGKRIIRVGVKGPSPVSEKAYRLFIEERREPDAVKRGGAQVNVVLRFGVPIFVAPAAPKGDIAMGDPEAARGKVRVSVRNDGNVSVKFESVDVLRGNDVLGHIAGWYVLPGAARTFEIPMDPARCVSSGTLEVAASAPGNNLKRPFAASPALCERP